MNRKLHRILDDIQNTEKKIAVWQNHLDELNARKEMLENAEIIKSIRSMRLGSRELLSVLEGVQNGTIILSEKQKAIEGLEENGIMASMNQAESENHEVADLTEENETLENIGSEREVLMNEREN
jgi:flagellar biogenesis protein FliO